MDKNMEKDLEKNLEKDLEKNSAPYSWIKKVKKSLIENDSIPLIKISKSFSWKDFSTKIKESLKLQNVNISSSSIMWRSKEDLLDGIGEDIISTSINVSPLSSCVFWIMNKNEIKKITNGFMTIEGKKDIISSEIIEEGFYNFLMANILKILENSFIKQNIHLKIVY